MVSAASWRTWSIAVRAMAPLVQPMVRVPPRGPSPPSSLPVGPLQGAPVLVPLSPLFPPRYFHSHHLCLLLRLHLLQQWLVWQHHLLLIPSHHSSHLNTFSPPLPLGLQPSRNAASSPAGLVHLLLLRSLLLYRVRFC